MSYFLLCLKIKVNLKLIRLTFIQNKHNLQTTFLETLWYNNNTLF